MVKDTASRGLYDRGGKVLALERPGDADPREGRKDALATRLWN